MDLVTTRRALLGGAAVMAGMGPFTAAAAPARQEELERAFPFKLGIATYSLRGFSRSGAIKAIKKIGTPYINIKEFHLPLYAPREEILAARSEFEREKLVILGGGNIAFRRRAPGGAGGGEVPISAEEMQRNFEYAKLAGMPVMVMAPMPKSLPKIEALARQYDIKVAIHNHGPEDSQFPGGMDVLKHVKNMDPRMGLCLDLGHAARAGEDVVAVIKAAGPRLHDIHMKDLRDFKDKNSQVPVGEGAMPVAEIFKALKQINYRGGVMLEYEIEEENPVPGMQRSFAYMRGVLTGLMG